MDLQLPKKAQATCGRPKGALNKEKTTRRDPSSFEQVKNKRKMDENAELKKKRQKLEDLNATRAKKEANKKKKEEITT